MIAPSEGCQDHLDLCGNDVILWAIDLKQIYQCTDNKKAIFTRGKNGSFIIELINLRSG